MDLHLKGKVAVVTGASKGIGLAVAQALAAEGARVAAGAREMTDDLTHLAEQAGAHLVPVDLSTADGPTHLIAEAVAAFDGIDILVNNVGAIRPRVDGFLSVTDDEWLWENGVAATLGRANGSAPEEVAEAVADLVVLLASDRAGNVTGADFVIDGGLVTTL